MDNVEKQSIWNKKAVDMTTRETVIVTTEVVAIATIGIVLVTFVVPIVVDIVGKKVRARKIRKNTEYIEEV